MSIFRLALHNSLRGDTSPAAPLAALSTAAAPRPHARHALPLGRRCKALPRQGLSPPALRRRGGRRVVLRRVRHHGAAIPLEQLLAEAAPLVAAGRAGGEERLARALLHRADGEEAGELLAVRAVVARRLVVPLGVEVGAGAKDLRGEREGEWNGGEGTTGISGGKDKWGRAAALAVGWWSNHDIKVHQ